MTITTDKDTIRKLIDGDLGWDTLENEVLPDPKDPDRFQKTREILQERVDWDNPILVPLNDHLYVVGAEDGRIVKCDCGHEFCSADENWRRECGIHVREGEDEQAELYSEVQSISQEWGFQYREFFCPGCAALLAVDTVPTGYPVFQKFEPDIDTFYKEWLGTEPPDKR
jgi:acetone carboxylase gamma subunit